MSAGLIELCHVVLVRYAVVAKDIAEVPSFVTISGVVMQPMPS